MGVRRTGPHAHAVAVLSMALAGCYFGDFSQDAGPDDAGVIDAAPPPPDAQVFDATVYDAGPPDADLSDAGPHSIGPLGPGLSTLAGHSESGLLDGNRDVSLLNNPVNVVVGPSGDIFVADFDNSAVRRITPTGATTTLVHQEGFSRPFGMAFTPTGEFYVQTDRSSLGFNLGALWQVDLETGVATLEFDGCGRWRGLASLSDGRLAVGDASEHSVKIYDPILNTTTIIAGDDGVAGFSDGFGSSAHFDTIRDLVVTSTDEIFVTDAANNRIRHVTLAGYVSTVAGNGVAASTDGVALDSSVNRPSGLALNGDDVLYIGEFSTGLIRELRDGVLSTIAGSVPGFADNTDPLLGLLFSSEGMDFAMPNLYVSDGNSGADEQYHRVRRIVIEPLDAGVPDAGSPDAASPDAGSPDAASPDAAVPDAASPDAAAPDAA